MYFWLCNGQEISLSLGSHHEVLYMVVQAILLMFVLSESCVNVKKL